MPAHLWFKDPIKHRWYCKPDYRLACETDQFLMKKVTTIYDNLDDIENKMAMRMPNPCCGARYVPWGRGESQVVEIDLEDENGILQPYCFIAARLPQQLDDEIKKKQAEWVRAQWQLSDKEIIGYLPKVYPCDKYLVNRELMPAIGRFPVDEWIADKKPILDTAGWLALAIKIASNDMKNLAGIFDLGRSLESEMAYEERRKEKILAERDRASSSTALATTLAGTSIHEHPEMSMI